jgi:hypothetical protein
MSRNVSTAIKLLIDLVGNLLTAKSPGSHVPSLMTTFDENICLQFNEEQDKMSFNFPDPLTQR